MFVRWNGLPPKKAGYTALASQNGKNSWSLKSFEKPHMTDWYWLHIIGWDQKKHIEHVCRTLTNLVELIWMGRSHVFCTVKNVTWTNWCCKWSEVNGKICYMMKVYTVYTCIPVNIEKATGRLWTEILQMICKDLWISVKKNSGLSNHGHGKSTINHVQSLHLYTSLIYCSSNRYGKNLRNMMINR